MQARKHRPVRPAQIVAYVLVALAALGLAFLHFTTRDDRVSMPAGAHAGKLTLKPCKYATERGSHAADCGTLVVSENRHDPGARLIPALGYGYSDCDVMRQAYDCVAYGFIPFRHADPIDNIEQCARQLG